MKNRPNTTQRSWSNYVGDKPVRNWVGTDAYADSPLYGVGGSEVAAGKSAGKPKPAVDTGVNEGFMTPEQRRKRREQESALKKGFRGMNELKPIVVEPVSMGQQLA